MSPSAASVVGPTAGGETSSGAAAKPVAPLPLTPPAATEKSMLRQELWPLAASFANFAGKFNEEMSRVTSHFLVKLDVARER